MYMTRAKMYTSVSFGTTLGVDTKPLGFSLEIQNSAFRYPF